MNCTELLYHIYIYPEICTPHNLTTRERYNWPRVFIQPNLSTITTGVVFGVENILNTQICVRQDYSNLLSSIFGVTSPASRTNQLKLRKASTWLIDKVDLPHKILDTSNILIMSKNEFKKILFQKSETRTLCEYLRKNEVKRVKLKKKVRN